MSKELNIDGVRFESSASIAQRFNYTQDYVGKLARDGKVSATKVGRFWFIDVVSFEQFIKIADEEKVQRSEALRAERRLERDRVAGMKIDAKESFAPEKSRARILDDHYVALAQTVAVVFCGLFVGVLGWTAQDLQVAQLQQGGVDVYQQLQEVFVVSDRVASGHVASEVLSQSASVAQSVERVQVFADLLEVKYFRETVEESDVTVSGHPFSDEVEVVRQEGGAQIVRPVFGEVEYRVFVEPVNPNSS